MAGSLQIAVKPNPNSTTTVTNASATGIGVGGVDSAAIISAITAETAHKPTGDGTGRGHVLSPPDATLGPREAPKDLTKHTTINRYAGGRMRDGIEWI